MSELTEYPLFFKYRNKEWGEMEIEPGLSVARLGPCRNKGNKGGTKAGGSSVLHANGSGVACG